MQLSLENKTIMIYGATSTVAVAFMRNVLLTNCKIVLCARNEVKLQEVLRTFNDKSNSFISIVGDLTMAEDILVEKNLDGIKFDAVLYCLGYNSVKLLQFVSNKDLKDIFEVNLFAAIRLVRTLVKRRFLGTGASIVLISSVMGDSVNWIGSSSYSSAKAALIRFAEVISLELARRNVRLNTVSPGLINNEFISDSPFNSNNSERKSIEVEETVGAINFLLDDISAAVNGVDIVIDRGERLRSL